MKKCISGLLFILFAFCGFGQEIPRYKITEIENRMNQVDAGILVINFWATFCKPCVAEIPSFIKVVEKYKEKNVKLMLVSVDLPSYYPEKIAAFAKKNKFDTNISWLDETNADYFCPKIDSAWSGAIPATIILNPKTGYRKFFEGQISEKAFEETLLQAIRSTASVPKNEAGN